MKQTNFMIIAVLAISTATLTVSLIPEEEVSLTHCGAGQYLDTDTKTCILKSSVQTAEEKIVEKIVTETVTETVTNPSKVLRGINEQQNVFIVDNGINPTVFLQDCDGLTILNNPVMTSDGENSFTLRDSEAGLTIFVDKTSTYQYQITTIPYSGESFNTVATELMRSDKYNLSCEEKEVDEPTQQPTQQSDELNYEIRLSNNDSVLSIEGDVGKIIDNKREITGMIVLYEGGKLQDHMVSFNINLDSDGEFFETVDVSGTTPSGKVWKDNEDYRVLITYDGEQLIRNFEK